MKKTIAISIIVCFLLCGCVAQSDEADLTISQFGNTIGNILEGGFVVERDGWIYYCNNDKADHLFKATHDGRQIIELNEHRSYEINVMGDWVYYIQGMPGEVCRVKTDGTKQKVLFYSDAQNLIATDKYLFFRQSLDGDYTKLFRMDFDGKKRRCYVIAS